MLTDQIPKLFSKEVGPEGLSSVSLVKICSQLGYSITRNTLRELVESGIVCKPALVNDSDTTGKRVAYSYQALIQLLVYEILTDSHPGLTKGSALSTKKKS